MKLAVTFFLTTLGAAGLAVSGDGGADRVAASRAAAQSFMLQQKGELSTALRQGGPVESIEVCRVKAPELARRVSAESGWRVARTSLRVRNPSNAPDRWERGVLERFEERRSRGEDPGALEHFAVLESEGTTVFRYMKAIPTRSLCLTCHGEQLDPSVARELRERYPGDQATGFAPGDIRGAITITQPIEE
jgi:hypothetical protein